MRLRVFCSNIDLKYIRKLKVCPFCEMISLLSIVLQKINSGSGFPRCRANFGGSVLDYKGIKGPVCGKPFTENDDIVVCPVCGAPYHRECYKEKGACIFTDLHESGKTWAPPAPPDAPNTASELKDKECPNCGTLNAHSAR